MQQGLNDDLYNQVADYRNVDDFTERERMAIEFAERYATAHTTIDDTFFAHMKTAFSDQEMVELVALCALCVGLGRALVVLDVERDFDVLWSREPAAQ